MLRLPMRTRTGGNHGGAVLQTERAIPSARFRRARAADHCGPEAKRGQTSQRMVRDYAR
jgi:hypothetical protein